MFERFFQIAHSCNFATQVFVPKLSTFPIIRLQDRIQSKLVQQEHRLKIKLVSGKQLHATTSGGSLKFLPECEYNTYGCFFQRVNAPITLLKHRGYSQFRQHSQIMISFLQKEIYQHREVDFRATWVLRPLYRRHLCANGKFDRWLVPNNTTCVVLRQFRLSIWRSGDSVDQLILFQNVVYLEFARMQWPVKKVLEELGILI